MTSHCDADGHAGYDFYVSYALADETWATWIAWTLEEAGYRVQIRAWDSVPGSHRVAAMDDGLQSSERMIAVLSDEYLSSERNRAEWSAAWADDPTGRSRRLLVARVADCAPAGLLGSVVPVDLFGRPQDVARFQLLWAAGLAVSGGRGKPTSAPPYPWDERAVSVQPSFPGPEAPDAAGHGAMFFSCPEPRLSDACAPSVLLRPEHSVAPFVELDGDRAALRLWAAGSDPVSVRLLAGAAGSGKTRLAMRVCVELSEQGWLTVVVNSSLSPAQLQCLRESDVPVLVVVDSAELCPDQAVLVAAALAEGAAPGISPRRLLLLTRSTELLLEDLRSLAEARAGAGVGELFRAARAQPRTPLPAGAGARHVHFEAAYTAFRVELRQTGPIAVPPADLVDLHSVLDVHAAALNACLDHTRGSRPPLATLLDHERRRWPGSDHGDGRLRSGLADRICALATLLRPGSFLAAEALSAQLPGILGVDAERIRQCQEELGVLYPGRWRFDQIRPDAYGEHVAAGTLVADLSLARGLSRLCSVEQAAGVLAVLGCALPRHPELATVIVELLRTRPDELVLVAADVATRLPDPELFARAVADAFDDATIRQLTLVTATALADRVRRGGRELGPLRGLTLRASAAGGRRLTADLTGPAAQDPATAGVARIAERVTDGIVDLLVGLVDPGSGRMPPQAGGSPNITPDLLGTLFDLQRQFRRSDPETK
ncbi:TIR domain-containing protein [Parafrankia discariae]|uniref:TIR domain-containing protein n=1 Tax=Parafrankia discariae TaxID=365528 RepID=UPI00037B3CA5|nr:TIR domain-containing protein [Parafrankia discariae]